MGYYLILEYFDYLENILLYFVNYTFCYKICIKNLLKFGSCKKKKVTFCMSGNDSLDSPNSPDKPNSHGSPLTILNL